MNIDKWKHREFEPPEIDFSSIKITITNTELIELTTKLEEEERLKFEVYNCLRKAEDGEETPSEFKARRNERIRKEYSLGGEGASIKALAKKYNVSIATVERIVKGIKKVKKLAYVKVVKRGGNHTESYRKFMAEKIERHMEIYHMKRVNTRPLEIGTKEAYEVVKFKHSNPKEDLIPDGGYMVDIETGEIIEPKVCKFKYGVPKSKEVVRKAEEALSKEPNAELMDELNKLLVKLRTSKKVIEL